MITDADFDRIDRELGVVTPHVYREFLKSAAVVGPNLVDYELYFDADALIEDNQTFRADWEQWQPHLLAFGVGDGCGNFFAISARSSDDDEMYLVAHDLVGIERTGTASDFFAAYLPR